MKWKVGGCQLEASLTPAHEVSSVLQSLIEEGALRKNLPKLSMFSEEMTKEVSFEQWCYELQTLRKTCSDSALREGIQRSLRGAAADTFCNLGPDVSLDTIIKKLTVVYGSVKSFDLSMRDFKGAKQEEAESVTSFAKKIEGLLSRMREKFTDHIFLQEEHRLLRDRLFQGCRKSNETVFKIVM